MRLRSFLLRRSTALVLLAGAIALLASACGGGRGGGGGEGKLSGQITADGSSTVGPFATYAAEQFGKVSPGVQVTVGISGTGGGFERFCAGETDLSDASRPIESDEAAICKKHGIRYSEFLVANDALTVVVNKDNDWAKCLTVEQLKKIWEPGSKIGNWQQVDAGYPDVGLKLYGPGTDSGTFDFFTEKIVGEEGASRADYSASENDNVLVQGVAGEKGGLGYFGFSYYDQHRDELHAVEIDGGNGCVAPSVKTAQTGTYTPLSRPLFIYAKDESLARPEVRAFIRYIIDNEQKIATGSQFVSLTAEQESTARRELKQATAGSTP